MLRFYDILVMTSCTKWEEPPRIRHQVALEMKKYFNKVLFVELPTFRGFNFAENVPYGLRQVEDNIFALRTRHWLTLPKNGHSLIPVISGILQKMALLQIKNALADLKCQLPLLINFTYTDYIFHDKSVFPCSIFLLNDEFIGRAPNAIVSRLVKMFQTRTARRADLCLAVSVPLLEQLKKDNPNSLLFLPGHSFGKMAKPNKFPQLDTVIKPNKTIKVCFMGYINNRLNLDWIKYAVNHKEIDFFLVGPNCLDLSITNELKRVGVNFLSALFGEDLLRFLHSCDVLTMPYVLNKATVAATAPNKLFQYIAAGRPIVSSALPFLIKFPPFVLQKASNQEEFVKMVFDAVRNDSSSQIKERLHIASENTWQNRGEVLFNLIENFCSPSGK